MKDVFKVVTDQILKQLEEGIIPWRRPWQACWPTSYATNKEYQGINLFLLQSRYESTYWLTFRQAQKMGGSIKAGEHGRPIVFVDRFVKEEIDKEGNKTYSVVRFLKYYTVFNWEQTKGIPEKKPVERDNQQIQSAEDLLMRRNPVIKPDPHQCYYLREDDALHLPSLERFDSSEDYYSAAFHELTHWTGGSPRLARSGIQHYHFGGDVRSLEELIAEMGAAYLCQLAGLDTSETLKNSAAYVQSWLKPLQDNPRWVLQASRQAKDAVEFVLTGKLPEARAHATATA
jgi:antirestriction protein ArdC